MNILVILGVIAAMVGLRFLRLNAILWLIAWWIGLYVVFRFGIDPPLPSSIVGLFMFVVTIALLAFMSADSERMRSAGRSVVRFVSDSSYRLPLIALIVLLPLVVAWRVYVGATSQPSPPVSGRTIHPVPPPEIQFKGKSIDLVSGTNPFRSLEEEDPDQFASHVEKGRRLYYENCVYCHGDDLAGQGIFAHGYDPLPADFQDSGTIAMLQESYLFWRIAKGGPGLPNESTPWSSAMPAWEQFMSEDDIWDVILFLYDYTGHRPREREEVH